MTFSPSTRVGSRRSFSGIRKGFKATARLERAISHGRQGLHREREEASSHNQQARLEDLQPQHEDRVF